MSEHMEPSEILSEVMNWAAGVEREPYSKRDVLSQVSGIETSARSCFGLFDMSAAWTAGKFRTSRESLPVLLATWMANVVRARHLAALSPTEDGTAYTLQWWLAWPLRSRGKSYPSFRVTVDKSRSMTIRDAVTGKALEIGQLRQVRLRHRSPSKLRREYLSAVAANILHDLEALLIGSPSDLDWLRRMIDDPAGFENDALEIWHGFITECDLPSSFRIPERTLSLADLMTLRAGSEGGRHRHSFAEQQPWAAHEMLRESSACAKWALIDQNPANAIAVSAELLCCTGRSGCDKAAQFARSIARHRNNSSIDSLLGVANDPADRKIRSLLIEAHRQDGELFTHIGSNGQETRRQIEYAIELIYAYRDRMQGSVGCAYELATLVIRMMARNRIDLRIIDKELFLSGLVTMSADSLAAFASDRIPDAADWNPEPDSDSLDLGLLAFVAFLGRTRKPQLTALQLNRFAEAANRRGVHKISAVKNLLDASWRAPRGWPTGGISDPRGEMRVSALTSIKGLLDEGRRMEHCLGGGRYNRAAILGRLAFFSISADGDRATLAAKPHQRFTDAGEIWIDRWEIDQLRSVANSESSDACKNAADLAIKRLNEQYPYSIRRSEVDRRDRIRTAMDASRGINTDLEIAQQRWDEIYVKLLPSRFADLSPSRIVEDYAESLKNQTTD